MSRLAASERRSFVPEAVRAAYGDDEKLLDLLDERAAIYKERTPKAASALRARVLVKLSGGLEQAVPYCLEELETGFDAVALAAAANYLRTFRPEQLPEVLSLTVIAAIRRIAGDDRIVRLDNARDETSAVAELATTLAHFGPNGELASMQIMKLIDDLGGTIPADPRSVLQRILNEPVEGLAGGCCGSRKQSEHGKQEISIADIRAETLEDQDGETTSFGKLCSERPTFLFFFYTRCMNPLKCSRNVTFLGDLDRMLAGDEALMDIGRFGISYDPAYDLPTRLRAFGEKRGLAFNNNCKLLRSANGSPKLLEALELKFGRSATSVNAHAIEALLLGHNGNIVHRWEREAWTPDEVINAVRNAPPS